MYPDNLTRDEADRRSKLIQTHSYAIEIDLSGREVSAPEQQFVSTSSVEFTAYEPGGLHIDLIADRVLRAELDGVEIDPAGFADSRLGFEVTEGTHQLNVKAVFFYSRSGQGLHRFVDPLDQRTYLYTQFEASDARRAYACFEQPDLKARFSISVIAPQAWRVVSSGSAVARTDAGDGFARTEFGETLPISTYLTALVAGDYHAVEHSYSGTNGIVEMSVLCRQSLVAHLDDDVIIATTNQGFEVFEKHFAFPYPFGKYDQVFVPEYNGGAMENIGCVTFRDEYIFRSRVTAATSDFRRGTILHELSHMWFGNLVTMKWWDDLWLKESFATWASNFAISEVDEDPSLPWASFRSGSKTVAYRQDQLPSTHPVSADIVDLEALEYNFDQITYAKGASVLVQLVAFVGRETFLAGVRSYFADHAYGNTTLVDLLAALEKVSGQDLTAWSAQWLETAGVNTLELELAVDGAGTITAADLLQTAPAEWPTLRRHRLALGLYDLVDGSLARVDRIEVDLSEARTPVPGLIGRARPDAIVINDDDLTYAKMKLDPHTADTVLAHLATLPSALSRAVLWGALWDACRDAELPAERYVDVVLRSVLPETGLTAVSNVLGQAATAVGSYAPPTSRDALRDRWERDLAELLAQAPAGSDHQLSLARAYVWAVSDGPGAEDLAAWLIGDRVPTGLLIDADFRWSVVASLARLGRLSAADIEAELVRDGSITGSEQAAGARAARPDAGAKAEAWRLAVEEDSVPNATQGWICLRFWQRDQDELLEPYIEKYFRAAEEISAATGVWAVKGSSMRKNVLRNLFPWPADLDSFLTRLDAWLAGADLNSSTKRAILERRDDLVRSLRCQQAAV
ncbi:MAG TPA: aminopeptidase N [Propionibacteriaceae bacterium]